MFCDGSSTAIPYECIAASRGISKGAGHHSKIGVSSQSGVAHSELTPIVIGSENLNQSDFGWLPTISAYRRHGQALDEAIDPWLV